MVTFVGTDAAADGWAVIRRPASAAPVDAARTVKRRIGLLPRVLVTTQTVVFATG
jgi:hypothetical protein